LIQAVFLALLVAGADSPEAAIKDFAEALNSGRTDKATLLLTGDTKTALRPVWATCSAKTPTV